MSRTPVSYFEGMYAELPDPWGMERRWYERRKYALTVACLPRGRYLSGFEAGCSVGVLTEALAGRCDRLLACDHLEAPLRRARARTATAANVTIERRSLPEEWPAGPFDLLVLSEIAYYFDEQELAGLVASAQASLRPGADVVAVHWRGPTDYPLSGDRAHAALAATEGWQPVAHHEEAAFLLDVWTAT